MQNEFSEKFLQIFLIFFSLIFNNFLLNFSARSGTVLINDVFVNKVRNPRLDRLLYLN